MAPHEGTLELVHSWLEHHGVPASSISRTHGGGWLTITSVPVSQADKLLCASYQLYKHTGANETEAILRTVSYALPEALHPHVQTVAPTTYFASSRTLMQAPRKRFSDEAAVVLNATSLSKREDPTVTPAFLRSLYKTETYVPAAGFQNALGTLGLQGDYPDQADLTDFMAEYREDAVDATFYVEPVNGGGDHPGHPGVESSLDMQYGSAISYPTPQIFYDTGGPIQWENGLPAPGDAYLEWLRYLLSQQHIPPTITVSWGNPETSVPWTYATPLCIVFAQLGLRGISVLVATGDDGVGRGDCRDPSGNVRFYTMFPASCRSSNLSRSTQRRLTATFFFRSLGH